MFIVQLDFFSLNLALPAMSEDLGVSVTDLQWVISGYMLALASFFIPGGRLGDIFGRRQVLIVGVAIFITASAVCGAVSSAGLIIGFRVLQGIGGAIIFPLAVAVVSNAFPEQRRARAIGNLYGPARPRRPARRRARDRPRHLRRPRRNLGLARRRARGARPAPLEGRRRSGRRLRNPAVPSVHVSSRGARCR